MIMEMAKPGFETYAEVWNSNSRSVKVIQHQKRCGRSLNLVDAYQQGPSTPEEIDATGDQQYNDEEVEFENDLAEIYSLGLQHAEEAVEANALMNRSFNRSGPPRGRIGPPPQRGAGFRDQPPRSASAPGRPPPRDRADVQCLNCNRKGHTAQECRQPKIDKSQRTCFLCDKPGHVARDCKERKAPSQAVQQQAKEAAFLGCVCVNCRPGRFYHSSTGRSTARGQPPRFPPLFSAEEMPHCEVEQIQGIHR